MKKYIIAAGVGGILAAVVLAIQGYGNAASTAERYRILCDAFTVPGLVLILTGILSWVAGEGLFDGLSYGIRSLFRGFTRWEHIRYGDYIQGKQETWQPGGYGALLLTGGGFLLPAVAFFALFYNGF